MKSIYKYVIAFFVIYALVSFGSTMVIYSWTAFGGINNMNLAQKVIFFFFNFPSVDLKIRGLLLTIFLNSFFWSFCFLLFLKIFNKRKLKLDSNGSN